MVQTNDSLKSIAVPVVFGTRLGSSPLGLRLGDQSLNYTTSYTTSGPRESARIEESGYVDDQSCQSLGANLCRLMLLRASPAAGSTLEQGVIWKHLALSMRPSARHLQPRAKTCLHCLGLCSSYCQKRLRTAQRVKDPVFTDLKTL